MARKDAKNAKARRPDACAETRQVPSTSRALVARQTAKTRTIRKHAKSLRTQRQEDRPDACWLAGSLRLTMRAAIACSRTPKTPDRKREQEHIPALRLCGFAWIRRPLGSVDRSRWYERPPIGLTAGRPQARAVTSLVPGDTSPPADRTPHRQARTIQTHAETLRTQRNQMKPVARWIVTADGASGHGLQSHAAANAANRTRTHFSVAPLRLRVGSTTAGEYGSCLMVRAAAARPHRRSASGT
jgi:hypothetical protein